jgi:cytoskeletal protein CcmA (bactofilin family)
MWKGNGKNTDHRGEDENFTFLSRGASFKGIAHFEGTVRIDGRFEGELYAKGNLVIGEHAVIKGTITAATLIAGGKIKGDITGTEKVQLLKSAILIGDVRTPSFMLEEGAHFHGLCEMGVDRWMETEPSEPGTAENVHDLVAHREKLRAQDPS